MGNLSIVQGLLVCGTMGLILHILYLYLHLCRQKRLLEKQLQVQQQLMEQVFASIQNGPVQTLAFIMREVEIHQVPQQELLTYLRDVYQDVQLGLQNLNSRY